MSKTNKGPDHIKDSFNIQSSKRLDSLSDFSQEASFDISMDSLQAYRIDSSQSKFL